MNRDILYSMVCYLKETEVQYAGRDAGMMQCLSCAFARILRRLLLNRCIDTDAEDTDKAASQLNAAIMYRRDSLFIIEAPVSSFREHSDWRESIEHEHGYRSSRSRKHVPRRR